MQAAHPFDLAIALTPGEGGTVRGATSPAYANFIGPFGGITTAQLLQAVLMHPQRIGEPVALTVNFAAAVADGEFEIVAEPARTNRSTQHWIVRLRQGGETVITATALTAIRRDTWQLEEIEMPEVPAASTLPAADTKGRSVWFQRYDIRFAEGRFPSAWDGGDSGTSRTRVWMRDEPPRPLDFPALASLCDIFFPRIWLRRATFGAVGTVTLTIYFHATAQELQATGTGPVLGQAQGQGFRGGFFDQAAQLWNEAGTLLATTHQLVYYKE